jgi:YHYH protein
MRFFAGLLLLLISAPAFAHDVDLTKLPLGNGKLSAAPTIGQIWACRVDPNGGGAQVDGPWINKSAGTFDYTKKAVVSGQVVWKPNFVMSIQGDKRIFTSNDLPNHPTGIFPIQPNELAYQTDRNPNSIKEQSVTVTLPANPVAAAEPMCAPGAVGILLTGSVLFNALDAPGRDAIAHETQDSCQGHPQQSGVYHYHWVTTCIDDKRLPGGHSGLVVYALDGFGIFGRYGEKGELLSSSDLDACHGHTHAIPWNGKMVVMYHYHATWDFP